MTELGSIVTRWKIHYTYLERRDPMKWEYKVLSLPRSDEEKEEKLNELGADGWELVSVSPLSVATAFLKRAK